MMSFSLFGLLAFVACVTWLIANSGAWLINKSNDRFFQGYNKYLVWLSASLPVLLPTTLILVVLFIAYGKSFGWLNDHCLTHDLHHPHFCLAHFPSISLSTLNATFISGIGLLLAISLFVKFLKTYSRYQRTKIIARLGRKQSSLVYYESTKPMAFAFGFVNPKIYISNANKKLLTKKEQRIVIAHEAAHLRNKDSLKNIFMECFLTFHLFSNAIRKRFQLLIEIDADQQCTKRFKPFDVAQLLIKLGRFSRTSEYPISIVGSQLEQRITLLIETSSNPKKHWIYCTLLSVFLLLIPLTVVINHHALETIVGWLL
ncbi:M56 family metallopeptidase [Pleionea sediminis]|uniref:M56 family metallopeptidase n=1 Tax=Pleionea sediminis TaxID=2569479 RepID=UPI001186206E|nr:M56 family metallopeptidase [Pleionea sediminis]